MHGQSLCRGAGGAHFNQPALLKCLAVLRNIPEIEGLVDNFLHNVATIPKQAEWLRQQGVLSDEMQAPGPLTVRDGVGGTGTRPGDAPPRQRMRKSDKGDEALGAAAEEEGFDEEPGPQDEGSSGPPPQHHGSSLTGSPRQGAAGSMSEVYAQQAAAGRARLHSMQEKQRQEVQEVAMQQRQLLEARQRLQQQQGVVGSQGVIGAFGGAQGGGAQGVWPSQPPQQQPQQSQQQPPQPSTREWDQQSQLLEQMRERQFQAQAQAEAQARAQQQQAMAAQQQQQQQAQQQGAYSTSNWSMAYGQQQGMGVPQQYHMQQQYTMQQPQQQQQQQPQSAATGQPPMAQYMQHAQMGGRPF